jgi:hypothetical protein
MNSFSAFFLLTFSSGQFLFSSFSFLLSFANEGPKEHHYNNKISKQASKQESEGKKNII